VFDLKTARVTFLFDDGGNPAYSRTGHIVFTRGDTLLAVPFDAKSLTLTGTPVPLSNGIRTEYAFQPARFDLSSDGVLIYQSGGRTAEGRRLGVVDASGNVTPISDERRAFQIVHADPSGGRRFVAAVTNGQGIDELFAGRLEEEGLRRVFAVPDADVFTPVIARDGRTLAFGRRGRNAEDGFYVKDLDDAAPPRRWQHFRPTTSVHCGRDPPRRLQPHRQPSRHRSAGRSTVASRLRARLWRRSSRS
jgi:hypothetical protein